MPGQINPPLDISKPNHSKRPNRISTAFHYAHFFRDPIAYLRSIESQGPILALGSVIPLPRERQFVFALGPELNRTVLGNPAVYRPTGQTLPGPRNSAQRRLRYGLTRSRGEDHRQQRQFLLPAFQRPVVERHCEDMHRMVSEHLDDWSPGRILDIWAEMRRIMLRLSSNVLFGGDDGTVDAWPAERLGNLIGEWLDRNFRAPVWMVMLDVPGTPYRGLLEHAERIEREILEMLARKRATGLHGDDVFTMLCRAHEAGHDWMRDRDLVGQATILFAASYETTANAMTWTLFLLAQHPEVMSRLFDELEGLGTAAPTSRQLARLSYLDSVIKESMRILPPVPFTLRAVNESTELCGVVLHRGDRVVCSHYITHHQSDLYAEPERFHPERWANLRRGPYEYLPFSAGPRMCIGVGFAMASMKVALAAILRRFRLSMLPGTRVDRTVKVTLAPRNGLPMTIHAPDRRFEAPRVTGNVREMVDLP